MDKGQLGYLLPGKIVPAGNPHVIYFNPDSLTVTPAKGKALKTGKPVVVPTNANVHQAGKPKVIPIPDSLPVFTPGKGGVLLPRTAVAQGRTMPAMHPEPLPALAPGFRDNAIVNIQCLEVDQGMSSSSVLAIREDSRGNLWFGTVTGGVSRYDGSSFTHFTEKEGLSRNDVFSILEDDRGRLWFSYGTGGGVTKYDGRQFTHFGAEEGLDTRVVYVIFEDSQGNLWFGTEQAGVVKYDGSSFTFFTTEEGLSSNDVFSIAEDGHGNLWFGTEDGGACMYDGQSFTHFPQIGGLNDVVASILKDSRGQLWFGTVFHGVFKYDGNHLTQLTQAEGLSNNTVLAMVEDNQGQLWFGTRGGGVCKYDGRSFTYLTEAEGLSNNTVLSMGKDSRGNLWLGTEGGGVSKYVPGSFQHYTRKEGLKSNSVRTILEDSRGHLWLGTQRGDISRYDVNSFFHLNLKDKGANYIISAIEDSQGHIWFGTFGDGVINYDPDAGPGAPSFIQYSKKGGLISDKIELILEDSQGYLWFGSFEGGVTRYDGQHFTHFTEREGLGSHSVISLLEDSQGNLWFGTYGDGVSRYDGKGFATFTEKEGLSHNVVRTMLEDSQGHLWFGTEGGGISRYDGRNFTNYTLKPTLAENNIRSIREDDRGNFWIATMNGLYYVLYGKESDLPDEGQLKHIRAFEYGKQDGLKGVDFLSNSVCLDRHNHIWWGTEKGLTVLDLNKLNIPTSPPRIQLNQVFLNQNFVDFRDPEDVKQYDLTMSGVAPFYNYPQEPEFPHHVNSLTFYYSAIDWAAPHKLTYQYRLEGYDNTWSPATKETKAEYRNLPHGEYAFQVKAIGEAGIWSEPLEYRFYIHPPWWQTGWAYALYILLFFGILYIIRRYELKRRLRRQQEEVERARLEEKSKQADKIEAQARELERSFQELQEKNAEIVKARDQLIVQEKLASLGHLTAGIAHEIKNPLNFINNFAEGSGELAEELLHNLEKNKTRLNPDIYQYMKGLLHDLKQNAADIEKNGHKVDRIVRSMMDHARGTDLGWQAVDLNELLDENANLAYHSYRAIDSSFAVDIQKEYASSIPVVKALPQHIGRVFLNILNNACYAVNQKQKKVKNGYQPAILLTTRILDDCVEVRIRDNGPGISPEIRKEIFTPFFTTKPTGMGNTGLGLSISYDIIVKEHGGKLEVESEPGEFTEFTIVLPKEGGREEVA